MDSTHKCKDCIFKSNPDYIEWNVKKITNSEEYYNVEVWICVICSEPLSVWVLFCDSSRYTLLTDTITPSMDFYYIRHGETDWNKEDILNGPQNLSLNKLGIQQAYKAGLIFKDLLDTFSNPKIVSSPLLRAIETANEISKVTTIPIITQEDGLRERYYGDYRLISNSTKIPPDAETTGEFRKRIMGTLNKILREYQARPALIVSHQNVFEYVSETLSGHKKTLSQGGICHFITGKDGTWELEFSENR